MTMFLSKLTYDLIGHPKPTNSQLDEDLDRLLFLKGVEQPNHVYTLDERDPLVLNSEILSHWIKRRFEPTLLILLFDSEDNDYLVKNELSKMESFKARVEKACRYNFVKQRALQRAMEICSDNMNHLKLENAILRLKKTITFLSKHLEQHSTTWTLLGTDTYTPADIVLYNYLKRILVGRYKNMGLQAHVRLCEPIKQFMHRYASKNTLVIDVTNEDPLASGSGQNNLITDMAKPVVVALGVIVLYLWRRDNPLSISL